MKVVAIDPGSSCGWARYLDGTVISGVENLTPKRIEGPGMRLIRLEALLDRLTEKTCDLLVFEEVRRHMGVQAAHAYGAYTGIIKMWCEKNKIQFTSIPVQTIKACAINTLPESLRPQRVKRGHKRAKRAINTKEPVRIAAEMKFGKKMPLNDEADACWILVVGLKQYCNIIL